jgi:hypothetical protein
VATTTTAKLETLMNTATDMAAIDVNSNLVAEVIAAKTHIHCKIIIILRYI